MSYVCAAQLFLMFPSTEQQLFSWSPTLNVHIVKFVEMCLHYMHALQNIMSENVKLDFALRKFFISRCTICIGKFAEARVQVKGKQLDESTVSIKIWRGDMNHNVY